jgi:hypothetical protein
MSVSSIVRKSQQVISDNSPAILTGAAFAGAVVTTILAGRAGYKAGYSVALEEVNGVEQNESQKDRRKRIAKQTYRLYLPSAITGVGTLSSIVAANKIGTNRTAALAAAYTITDRAFTEYKAKVVETLGEKKEQIEIQDKIMQDRVDASGDRASLVVISNNDVLCYDAFTDRYFQSSMEKLKKAQNDTNYEILHSFYVSLSEFYNKVGLPPTKFSDEIGWNSDNLLELHFSSVMTPDDKPALAFNFHVDPIRRYDKVNG